MDKKLLRQVLARNIAAAMEKSRDADTQQALARRAKIGQSQVSRILRGDVAVGLDIIAALSEALHVQPWELLTDTEVTRKAALERMILGPSAPDSRVAEALPLPPKVTAFRRKKRG